MTTARVLTAGGVTLLVLLLFGALGSSLQGLAAAVAPGERAMGGAFGQAAPPPLTAVLTASSTPRPNPTPTRTPFPACIAGWSAVPAVDPGASENVLAGVAVLAPNNVWAAGWTSPDVTTTLTLIEHWDGSTWTVVPSANFLPRSRLSSIAAVAPNDIWAAGSAQDGARTLIEHWDGSAWRIVGSPHPSYVASGITGLAAVAANDVWAVGAYQDNTTLVDRTLILHWDGTQWTQVPAPNGGPGANDLAAVAAAGVGDVWAVGEYISDSTSQTLILHWDGTAWTVVPSPNPTTYFCHLYGVAVGGPGDVWAAGFYDSGAGRNRTLTEHWNGAGWSVVPSPNRSGGVLNAIAVGAGGEVWAVGYGSRDGRPLALHWAGQLWATAYPPFVTTGAAELNGIAAGAAHEFWGVGDFYNMGENWQRTVVEHESGACPGPTPTPCPLAFSDVPPSQPFAPYIQYLACRGLVSGYADGTFRPGAGITRGQVAKIVSNAAGFSDAIPPARQTFSDVPASSPFWLYVERAAAQGVISGYGDGTFRPGAAVTRGQVAKFVANAAVYDEYGVPAGRQSFADVVPADPFWLYIEEVAAHGVVGGYTCGAPPAGPCDAQHRPYFRPAVPVTRGQTAKFATLALYPPAAP